MNPFFKANNLIAIFIAVILIGAGSALFYVNDQRSSLAEASSSPDAAETAETAQVQNEPEEGFNQVTRATEESLSRVAMIHADHNAPEQDSALKTEVELIRDSIDWSDAPLPAPELVKTDDYDVYVNVTKEYLVYVFDKMGYTGDKIESGETTAIPPLIVVTINKGWADDETVQFKKSIFYRVILTLILYENEAVLRERDKLLAILDSRAEDGNFSAEQMERLIKFAHSYRVIKKESEDPLTEEQIQELLNRIDIVPPSLALAQAAHESGYATSRFAYTANALFGQWDWSANSIKPQQQREGMGNYGIKSFDQPIDSVRAYIWNLNTHRAYAGFRKERASQRDAQRGLVKLDSQKLADTLTSYSERGTEYTEELKGTIRFNRLERADHLRLMQGEPIYFN
ncbi:MAG: hypothetical protein GQ538_11305 [Xanthomonadales bacterium]|nr:hypothetical protein [Xanthomonadales bacterium]